MLTLRRVVSSSPCSTSATSLSSSPSRSASARSLFFADSVDFLEDALINLLIYAGPPLAAGSASRRWGSILAFVILVPAIATIWTAMSEDPRPATRPHPVPLTVHRPGGAGDQSRPAALLLVRHRHHSGSLTKAAWLSARNDGFADLAIITRRHSDVLVRHRLVGHHCGHRHCHPQRRRGSSRLEGRARRDRPSTLTTRRTKPVPKPHLAPDWEDAPRGMARHRDTARLARPRLERGVEAIALNQPSVREADNSRGPARAIALCLPEHFENGDPGLFSSEHSGWM